MKENLLPYHHRNQFGEMRFLYPISKTLVYRPKFFIGKVVIQIHVSTPIKNAILFLQGMSFPLGLSHFIAEDFEMDIRIIIKLFQGLKMGSIVMVCEKTSKASSKSSATERTKLKMLLMQNSNGHWMCQTIFGQIHQCILFKVYYVKR